MATKVEKTITVQVPVRTAYDQWTQFEEFPRFMGGISSVTQQGDDMTHWVMEIGGVKREWDARILEQVPDTKVSWAATTGSTNAGAVYFTPLGANETSVRLEMEYEPEGVVEKAADALSLISRRAEADLEKFKDYIEKRGTETGGWRGTVTNPGAAGTPGADDAAASRGDSGAAGISKTAAVLGTAAAAAGVAAVVNAVRNHDDSDDDATTTTVVAGATPGTPTITTSSTEVTTDVTTDSSTTGSSTTGSSPTAGSQYETIDPVTTTARDPFVDGADPSGAQVRDDVLVEDIDPVDTTRRTGGTTGTGL